MPVSSGQRTLFSPLFTTRRRVRSIPFDRIANGYRAFRGRFNRNGRARHDRRISGDTADRTETTAPVRHDASYSDGEGKRGFENDSKIVVRHWRHATVNAKHVIVLYFVVRTL